MYHTGVWASLETWNMDRFSRHFFLIWVTPDFMCDYFRKKVEKLNWLNNEENHNIEERQSLMCVSSDELHSLSMLMYCHGGASFSHSHIGTHSAFGSGSVNDHHTRPWRQHNQGSHADMDGDCDRGDCSSEINNRHIRHPTPTPSPAPWWQLRHMCTHTDADSEPKAEPTRMSSLYKVRSTSSNYGRLL